MTLWLIVALMTAAAIFAVLLPLARRSLATSDGSDVAVYRDQLDEVERDLTAGLIAKSEAEAARVEISRRLLAAAESAQPASATASPGAGQRRRRAVAVVAFLVLSAGAGALYLHIGSPGLPSETPGTRRSESAAIETMIAKVEAHLLGNPNDGRGWEVLAPVYMQLGHYADAAEAWRNALRLLGDSAEREAKLGEALMAQANGVVTADAKSAFDRAVTLDKKSVSARFYLGVAALQDGDRDKAIKIWHELIVEAPPGAHWVNDVRDALARVEANPSASSSGPTPADMAAAAQQAPEQQEAMIRGMVARLAERLKHDRSDLDGWMRLVRSYVVLGEPDKAKSAAADARHAIGADADKRRRFDDFIKALGLEG